MRSYNPLPEVIHLHSTPRAGFLLSASMTGAGRIIRHSRPS